jgi:hypothetical protein
VLDLEVLEVLRVVLGLDWELGIGDTRFRIQDSGFRIQDSG